MLNYIITPIKPKHKSMKYQDFWYIKIIFQILVSCHMFDRLRVWKSVSFMCGLLATFDLTLCVFVLYLYPLSCNLECPQIRCWSRRWQLSSTTSAQLFDSAQLYRWNLLKEELLVGSCEFLLLQTLILIGWKFWRRLCVFCTIFSAL